jgi:hypothetical protein
MSKTILATSDWFEERYETPPEPGKKDTFSMEGVWALLDEQGFKYDQ